MIRPRKTLAGVVAAVVAAAVVALPSAGASGFGGTFKSTAAADGIRATFTMPGVTVVKSLVDLGSTSTQASVNSLGESRSFASIPYPGDFVIVGPGTVAGATNGQVNLPNYPLYAWSDHPARPGQVVGDGPMTMRAESTEVASRALASAGVRTDGVGQLGLSRTESSIASEGEAVTAKATSETTSFKVGPLELGQVISVAEAVFDRSGKLTRKTDTRIVGAAVAGTPVQLSPGGVNVAGSAAPPPDLGPLNEALKPAGLQVELVPATETDTGVVAPAVRVTQQLQQGSRLVYQLGSASASVEGTADDSGGLVDEDGDGSEVTGGADATPPSGSAGSDAGGTGFAPTGPDTGMFDPGAAAPPAYDSSAAVPGPGTVQAPTGSPATATPSFDTGTAVPGVGEYTAEPAPPVVAAPDVGQAPDPDTGDEVAAVPVLASRLLDGGDSRPFYAAFIVAAIVGLAGVVGVALFSRALRSGA